LNRLQYRFGAAMAGANLAGGIVVFVFLYYVLPNPGVHHHITRLRIVNAATFVAFGLVSFAAVWIWNARRWRAALGWQATGRTPSDRERRLTLRLPLTQQASVAPAWLCAAAVFGAINAPASGTLASDVAITIVLGGLVTCGLGYLLAERLLRPITALALAEGVPAKPQLPGVRARALLSWELGAGVILLGILLVAIAALDGEGFTRDRLAIAVLVLSVVGMLVGLAMFDALARSVSDRIEALRRAVAKVEQGELESPVEVDDGSEVGLLQAGFNRMLVGLQERERMRDLFGRQVGEDVVRLALERGVELGGEARQAAVLFVDLEGSTTLAEKRDPAEVVALLNRFFAIVVEVVGAHDGWVNKFEGDAALCVFGAPLPDEHCAAQALGAARELCERVRDELPEIRAGIGVSAGRVVAGNVGAARRFEYTVIGDPVNQAARLTELAKERPERVLASAEALEEAGGDEAERWRMCDELTLRGRSRPTHVAVPRAQPVP
jgi:adenylate cyclase